MILCIHYLSIYLSIYGSGFPLLHAYSIPSYSGAKPNYTEVWPSKKTEMKDETEKERIIVKKK